MTPELFVTFVIIGIAVSLDVIGLTLTRLPEFVYGGKSPWRWALLNGGCHALMLTIYVFFFSTLLHWARYGLSIVYQYLLQTDLKFLIEIVSRLSLHLGLMFTFLALFIVWNSYQKKIDQKAALGQVSDLPWWIRWMVAPVNLVVTLLFNPGPRFVSRTKDVMQGLLVATDMLALAALINASHDVETLDLKLILIAMVFAIVTAFTLFAVRFGISAFPWAGQMAGQASGYSRQSLIHVLVLLRLLEPFIIFYFAVGLLGYVITGISIATIGHGIAAGILVLGLLQRPNEEKPGDVGPTGRMGLAGVIMAVEDSLDLYVHDAPKPDMQV